MRQLLLLLSLPTILIVISGSQSVSKLQKSSANAPDEKEKWNIGMPVHERPSRHKRHVDIRNALTNFGYFSSFLGVVGFVQGFISGKQTDNLLEEIQRSLKEVDRKIDGISRDIDTVLFHQRTTLFGHYVRRLKFFSHLAKNLTPQNGTWGPDNEAHDYVETVLNLRDDGVAQILHDIHEMVIGTSFVFPRKPIFLVFEQALDGSSSNYSSQVQQIIEFLDSIQSLGYALWMNALFIKGRNSSIAKVESVSKERFTNQTKLMRQLTTGWPSGSYGLPMTDRGCPNETEAGVKWEKGYRYHDTKNDNEWSRNLRFPAGSWGKDFVKQHFCMMTNKAGLRRWPNGEYCIFRRNDCPQGFTTGYIEWDDKNYNNSNQVNGYRPEGNYYSDHGITRIYYCCRSDGSFSNPIDLPTDKPFFLLRYKSTCQKVRNMRLSNQFFWWDDHHTNLPRHENKNSVSGTHPNTGSDSDNHKIHYCYYF